MKAFFLAGVLGLLCASAPAAECSKNDLPCRAIQGMRAADRLCPQRIEQRSEYAVRWTDEMGKPKFSRFTWTDQPGGAITYIGDRVEFQLASGAYQPMRYLCDMSEDGQTAIDARVYKGRLPLK